MQYICDFHTHSKYSRATSKQADIDNFGKWAKIKGVGVLGTGDFTHPLWFRGLKERLIPAEDGLFKLKPLNGNNHNGNNHNETRFILTTEISSIYSKNGRTRKIHNLIFAPSFEVVEKINTHLGWIGNLKSDGRPILGLDAKELAKIVLGISPDCMVIPAHAWTPWFSVFGHFSGFNSIEECFEEYSKYIYAIETGLSSDPEMNWRWSKLDNITLISNSDAHSPHKIGREANIFEGEKISYNLIKEAIIRKSDSLKLIKTLEFFPEEGKYHWDGHRDCGVVLSPEESLKYNNLCPVCGKMMTIGVMNRVCQLADRKDDTKPANAIPFQKLIPLEEIIADVIGLGVGTKGVEGHYKNLIRVFGNEFNILLNVRKGELTGASSPEIAEGIERVRQGKISVQPGYDGEFGKISIFGKAEHRPKTNGGQEVLF
ncbi:MAG TPA: endonuclease Q family protein [Candidatus Paceibacterota bacterium]|nr:endonuclease Q family protein [Candidatus Paceibacterota bacterium]